MIDQKQLENVEYSGNIISPGLPLKKQHSAGRRLFPPVNWMKVVKGYIWSIALYGVETWTFRKVDYKYLEIQVWCWR
jgi:hypothetical protein